MTTCPACRKGKLIKWEDTRYCNADCGFVEDIKPLKAQKWLLAISQNDKNYWRREFFDALPTFIAHEYRRLWLMTRRPNVFCMVYQLKDVGEVLMKFPVLCAAAVLNNDEVSALLVRKPLSIGDWKEICSFIVSEYGGSPRFELPECLRSILTGILEVYNKTDIANYRNDYLGHGAMGFEDNQDYRDFGENLIKHISAYLAKVMSDYSNLKVTVGDAEFVGWRIPKDYRKGEQPVLHIEGREVPLYPYMSNNEKHGILFFDYYKPNRNNKLANGLNYMRGGGRKSFVAPYYCEVYGRYFGNQIQNGTGEMDMTVEDSVSTPEIEKVLSELNEADNFVRPEYLINWLGGHLKDDRGAIHLLMMERGMGKTAFAYAVASGTVKYDDVFACAYYCGQTGMRSDYISGINNALATDLLEVQQGPDRFVRVERDVDDKRGSLLASLQYFRAKHAEKHHKSKLLLIIDGVDELPQTAAGLFDYLPDPADMPDNCYLLVTSRNPNAEKLPSHIEKALSVISASDIMRVSTDEKTESGKANHAVLKTYAATKIKVLDGGRMRALNKRETDLMLKLCGGTFLNLKLYAKLAESGIPVKELPVLGSKMLFERYLNEIKKYYGDKLFDEAMTVLYAIVTAEESLTLREAAWLAGDEFVTPKLLSFLRDFGALLKTTRMEELNLDANGAPRHNSRGSLIAPASERYRDYIIELFPEKRGELAEIFTDRLTNVDLDDYKDENGERVIPDGLFYMAAYLPKVTDAISEELRDKVCYDINDCLKNSMEPHILHRRAKMGEVWSEYCVKAGWYKLQLAFMNIASNSYSTMCNYKSALEIEDKRVLFCERYLTEGKIDDRNTVATAYLNLGMTYDDISKYDEALRDYDVSIEIMESLHRDGNLYDINDLAKVYMNRGITLKNMGKYDEALRDYGVCIEIRESLHRDGNLYDINDLAKAYMNRGVTLRLMGKYDEALRDYDVCIEIRESLHSDGKLYDINHLATAYMSRGVIYDIIGKYNEALRDYDVCIEIRESLHRDGMLYDINHLATAYMNRGATYEKIGKHNEALRDYGACIEIRESLHRDGRLYDINDLAKAYVNRGVTLKNMGKYDEALRDYDVGIEIMESLHLNGKLYEIGDLAGAMLNKGILLADGMHNTEGALDIWNKAIAILEAHGPLSYYAQNVLITLHRAKENAIDESQEDDTP